VAEICEINMMLHKIRLNLGAGKRYLEYKLDRNLTEPLFDPPFYETEFVQHDLKLYSDQIDIAWDLNKIPWPWQNETFTRIEAWAVFEHLKINLVESVNECWRIMRPGGKLHIKVPYWKHYRAWKDPMHYWRYEKGVFDYFDPNTKYGKEYDEYTPHKWRIVDGGWTDKKRTAIWADMVKILSEEQWEMSLKSEVPRRRGMVIWLTGRSQAGKSTIVRGLQLMFPHLVVVDDKHLWEAVWKHTYQKAGLAISHETKGRVLQYDDPEILADAHSDFAIELAHVAKVLAKQGHMVLVDMVASPQSRRDKIDEICQPHWIYVKREGGEYKTPKYEPPKKFDAIIDNDKLTKKQAIEKAARIIVRLRKGE